jgi:putative spermidine/putrescine transport system ATP-binding protein
LAPSGAPDVSVRGLTKRYGDVVAVDGIDLDIAAGEFFTMLGPSGSGKTTTLRMIAGFEIPDEGTIELAGEDVSRLPPYDRPVNTVFQDYALFPHMTVQQNVEYGLMVKKVAKGERKARAQAALEMVRLGEHGGRKPSQLSGGQRQRVALARAIVNRPKVLLLDEPLGALDFKLRQEMQIELKFIQREIGITFVYVTHDQEEALSLSDRVAVMKDGRVLQVGPPKELYERPRTRFVADFVGTNNLVPGEVLERRDQELIVRTAVGYLRAVPNGAVAGRCVLAIRPENVALGPAEGGGAMDDNVVSGRVAFVSYLGNTLRYDLETAATGDALQRIGCKFGFQVWCQIGSQHQTIPKSLNPVH